MRAKVKFSGPIRHSICFQGLLWEVLIQAYHMNGTTIDTLSVYINYLIVVIWEYQGILTWELSIQLC